MKKFLKKYKYDIGLLLTLVFFFVLSYFIEWNMGGVLSSRDSLNSFVESFGIIGPLIIIFIISLEVIVAPIPGFIPALTAGVLFGSLMGSIYIYIGNIIGSLIVFYLSRKYGKYIAEKLFNGKRLRKYEKAIERNENWLLVFYFIPVLPLDVLTAAFGLSAIKKKKFLVFIFSGYLVYSVALGFFGDKLADFLEKFL